MAGEPGRIVAPEKGSTVDLDPEMWGGLVTFFQEHYDYLSSGTEAQQRLAKTLTDRGIIKAGSRQSSN